MVEGPVVVDLALADSRGIFDSVLNQRGAALAAAIPWIPGPRKYAPAVRVDEIQHAGHECRVGVWPDRTAQFRDDDRHSRFCQHRDALGGAVLWGVLNQRIAVVGLIGVVGDGNLPEWIRGRVAGPPAVIIVVGLAAHDDDISGAGGADRIEGL